MTAHRRGARGSAVCGQCGTTFVRRLFDLRRAKRNFCSHACRNASYRTGPTMAVVGCAGCGTIFAKTLSAILRIRYGKPVKRHYCTMACFMAHADYEAMGRAGATAPDRRHDPVKASERARKGGFARAAKLSKDRLREIAQLGVKARASMTAEQWREAQRKRRFGSLVVLGVRVGRRP